MWPPWPHIAVLIYYMYKLSYLFLGSMWIPISYCSIFILMGFTPLRVDQNPKYSILVWPNNDLSILQSIPFSFSLFRDNSNLFTWSVQSRFVNIKILSMYACINSNPWNKSFIFCWKISAGLSIPIGRWLWQYFPHGKMVVQN